MSDSVPPTLITWYLEMTGPAQFRPAWAEDSAGLTLTHWPAPNVDSYRALYSAVGGGAVRLDDVNRAMTEVGIVRGALRWTTINLLASAEDNIPGVLAQLAGLVSHHGGNILRSVNNTLADGGFSLCLVVSFPEAIAKSDVEATFRSASIAYKLFEIV